MADQNPNLPNHPNSEKDIKPEQMLAQLQQHPMLMNYLPTHSKEHRDMLEYSILEENRLREKLLIWRSVKGEYFLLDGHCRFEVLKKHAGKDISWEYEIIGEFDELTDMHKLRERLLIMQMQRRHLTLFQQAYLRGREFEESKKAPHRPQKRQMSQGRTKDLLAAKFKVSPATIERDAAFYKGILLFAEFYAEGETLCELERILLQESIFTKGDMEAAGKIRTIPELLYRFKKEGGDLRKVLAMSAAKRDSYMLRFCNLPDDEGLENDGKALMKAEQKRLKKIEGKAKKQADEMFDEQLDERIPLTPLSKQFFKWSRRLRVQVESVLAKGDKIHIGKKRKELQAYIDQIALLMQEMVPVKLYE
jgi:hypothetical protein